MFKNLKRQIEAEAGSSATIAREVPDLLDEHSTNGVTVHKHHNHNNNNSSNQLSTMQTTESTSNNYQNEYETQSSVIRSVILLSTTRNGIQQHDSDVVEIAFISVIAGFCPGSTTRKWAYTTT